MSPNTTIDSQIGIYSVVEEKSNMNSNTYSCAINNSMQTMLCDSDLKNTADFHQSQDVRNRIIDFFSNIWKTVPSTISLDELIEKYNLKISSDQFCQITTVINEQKIQTNLIDKHIAKAIEIMNVNSVEFVLLDNSHESDPEFYISFSLDRSNRDHIDQFTAYINNYLNLHDSNITNIHIHIS